jgi:hypothetical protein
MAVEVEPAELARLLDYSERPRVEDWSLRAALCRYAQPQPQRVSDVLTLVRRIEFALRDHLKLIERNGPEIWSAVGSPDAVFDEDPLALGLLRAMADLDALGDRLAAWAVDRRGASPDAALDEVVADVAQRLDRLGVPHEERVRPPRDRGV